MGGAEPWGPKGHYKIGDILSSPTSPETIKIYQHGGVGYRITQSDPLRMETVMYHSTLGWITNDEWVEKFLL